MEIVYRIIKVAVYLLSFIVTFYAMRSVNYEKLLKKGHVAEAQVLYYLLVAAISYLVGSFVMVFIGQ